MRLKDLGKLLVLVIIFAGGFIYEKFVRCPDTQVPVYSHYKSDRKDLIANSKNYVQTPFGFTKVMLRNRDISDKEGKYFVFFVVG